MALLTDEDDDVAAGSSQHFAGPGTAHRLQTRLVAGDQDGGRSHVTDELQCRHGLQQGRVPVTVAVGLLETLPHKDKTTTWSISKSSRMITTLPDNECA